MRPAPPGRVRPVLASPDNLFAVKLWASGSKLIAAGVAALKSGIDFGTANLFSPLPGNIFSFQPTRLELPQGRSELVLVVEDDPDVRDYIVETVGDLGYSVLSAPDGASALRLLDSHREVSLLFTDVGLPGGMNGRQLAEHAVRRRPRLKVLYTTAYARNAIVHQGASVRASRSSSSRSRTPILRQRSTN